jgi:oligopeptide/dipeptide ABC transporter ATP-binding protein
MLGNQKVPLLDVKNLKTYFYTEDGVVRAVDGVDLRVYPGEIVGLVGESGCGKSVTSLSIMRLISKPGKIDAGEIWFNGKNIMDMDQNEMRNIRGNFISMIFQQPQTSLNPIFSAGDQIAEVLQIHKFVEKKEAWNSAVELLKLVGIPDPEQKAKAYPHELSGGQAQRVMIAIALALLPELLIADEPTTALDVTIQAQILDLLRGLQEKFKTAVILITHDLGVIAEMAERVAVMYAGKIVEQASVKPLFGEPLHPYTKGLIGSIPVLGKIKDRLDVIPGTVPNLINLPPGCRFAPRCRARQEYGLKICTAIEPDLNEVLPEHFVRCWLYQSTKDHQAPMELHQSSGWSNVK